MVTANSTCGIAPITLLQALANTQYVNDAGETYTNVMCVSSSCDDDQAAACGSGDASDYEQFLISKMFGIDSCGKYALKIGGVCIETLVTVET